MACLRIIMGVTRFDRLRNTHIRTQLTMEETIIDRVATKRLRYFGHISRMNSKRYAHILLNGNVHGKRPRGRPAKRWTDCIKADCNNRQVDPLTKATRLTEDRKVWQAIVKQKPSYIPVMVWTAYVK